MFGRQRRAVAALVVREELARARVNAAAVRVRRAKARFLARPLNLLLPFTAGVLGGALALYRQPAGARRAARARREGVAWGSILKTATTLWGLSLPLREALNAAADTDTATRPSGAPRARPPVPAPPPPGRVRAASPDQPAPPV